MTDGVSAVLASRAHFPGLCEKSVYLDSAATSLTPEPVLRAMDSYYRAYRASTHRGLYESAERATEAYESARAQVAAFVGAAPEEVVFTSGATAASNMLVYALEHSRPWREHDEVLTTVMEHHAALIPLQELATRRRLTLTHAPLKGFNLDYEAADTLITERTKLVSVMLASNVLGTVNDVARIARRAHDVGALVIVDATAAVGHIPVDVQRLGCDFLYFSGHKMCGPTGVGVLYGKRALLETLHPGFFGGGMVDTVSQSTASWAASPQRFEAGTPNVAGVIGLGASVHFLEAIGISSIQAHVRELTSYARTALSSVPGLTCYHEQGEENVGIASFTIREVHPHDIAQVCAHHHVAIRAGHHCVMPLHTALNITASARASFYLYTTRSDIDALQDALNDTVRTFS